MAAKYERVYQFKIFLNDIEPLIWRCIQVPENYSFWDLHVAIQDAMGWFDCHLHEFKIRKPVTGQPMINRTERIGIPDENYVDPYSGKTEAGWELYIRDYFVGGTQSAEYIYDFGDSWEHTICLEKVLPREPRVKYPKCIAGERACPPEDCGSAPGYMRLLEAMQKPRSAEYKNMLQWLGHVYKPEVFSTKIRFDNPKDRLKVLL